MELFIGNLPYDMTEHDLRTGFRRYGMVSSVVIPKDLFTGEPKGLAFITLEAQKPDAVAKLTKVSIRGRILNIEPIGINYSTVITKGYPGKKQ